MSKPASSMDNYQPLSSSSIDTPPKLSIPEVTMDDNLGLKRRASSSDVANAQRRRILDPPEPKKQNKDSQSQLQRIPTENWEQIFSCLDLADIKSVRLAWRQWTAVASRLLFPKFVFKIDRKDIERFEEVAKDENFLAGIKTLRFETAITVLEDMQASLGMVFSDMSNRMQMVGPDKDYTTNNAMIADKAVAIDEYASWNVRWHEAKQEYRDLERMKRMLMKVKSLNRVEFSVRETSFTSLLLMQSWTMCTRQSACFSRASKNLFAFLVALKSTPREIKHLYHDRLPVTFFARSNVILTSLAEPLKYLTSLRLIFQARTHPHAKFWSGLGSFLKAIPSLEVLRLGFQPANWPTQREGLGDWYVPLWNILSSHTWIKLRELRLDGLLVCENGLFDLLSRHAKTLKVLKMYHIGLWFGSMENLFVRLRMVLNLKKFKVMGETRAVHSTEEHWRIWPDLEVDDDFWSQNTTQFVKDTWRRYGNSLKRNGDCSPDDVCSRLENFMTSEDPLKPWPLNFTDFRQQLSGAWSLNLVHSADCEHADRSVEEIDAQWENRLKNPLKDWLDFDVPEGPGIGEDLFIPFYGNDGFDADGYNQDGFDEDGAHYSEHTVEVPGVAHPVSQWGARREILDELLRAIPRYAALMPSQGKDS